MTNTIQQFVFDYPEYVDSVLKGLGLPENMPEDEKEDLKFDLMDQIDERVLQVTLSYFGPDEIRVYDALLEKYPDLDEIDAVFAVADNIPGLSDRLMEELANIRDDFSEYGRMHTASKARHSGEPLYAEQQMLPFQRNESLNDAV